MQQNKRKLKPHKLETLPIKLVLEASGVIQKKWMVNYNIEPKKSNSAKLLCYFIGQKTKKKIYIYIYISLCYFRSCLCCKITYEVLIIKYTG